MSSKSENPKWQTLDNFFTKAPVPSTQDHDHNTSTNSDSRAETPSNNSAMCTAWRDGVHGATTLLSVRLTNEK
jgi:hypothetical protein